MRGGYYGGKPQLLRRIFRVVNQNGKWIVKGARMEAIS